MRESTVLLYRPNNKIRDDDPVHSSFNTDCSAISASQWFFYWLRNTFPPISYSRSDKEHNSFCKCSRYVQVQGIVHLCSWLTCAGLRHLNAVDVENGNARGRDKKQISPSSSTRWHADATRPSSICLKAIATSDPMFRSKNRAAHTTSSSGSKRLHFPPQKAVQ
jgi:hypothetical protein